MAKKKTAGATKAKAPVKSTLPDVGHQEEGNKPDVQEQPPVPEVPDTKPEPPADPPAPEEPAVVEPPAAEPEPEAEEEAAAAPTFDPKGKVKVGQHEMDVLDKKHAKEITRAAHIPQHHKNILLQQIDANKIEPAYGDLLKKINSADAKGSVYDGTL